MSRALDSQRPAVRASFRLLAAVLCVAIVVAALGAGYMVWRGTYALQVRDAVMLPGGLWLIRLAFHAAVQGSAPREAHWPFASSRVAGAYMLLVIVFI